MRCAGRSQGVPDVRRIQSLRYVRAHLAGVDDAGLLLNSAAAALLTRTGAYRHIWHPALFNLALCIALLGGLFFLTGWMQS